MLVFVVVWNRLVKVPLPVDALPMFRMVEVNVAGVPITAEVVVMSLDRRSAIAHAAVAGQSCVALDPSAVHCVPPFVGAGLVQVRVSVLAERPQATGQVVVGEKVLQPPSMGAGVIVTCVQLLQLLPSLPSET